MRLPDLTVAQKEDIIDRFTEARHLGRKKRKIITALQLEYEITYSQLWCLCVTQERTRRKKCL